MPSFLKKQYGRKHKKVVFLIGGWTYTPAMLWITAKILESNGYYCITYTYHNEVFSPNTTKTVKELLAIKKAILQQISILKAQGLDSFSVFGTSLGTIPAILVANESSDITKVILNTSGADTAESVWSWDAVIPGFKENLKQQNFTKEQLVAAWKSISPQYNMDNLQGKSILIYLAKKDELIPYEQGERLLQLLQERKYPYEVVVNGWLNHGFTGILNLLNAKRYLHFLTD
ncbi:MAG: prolyl oligopeptidase family serine peptidase [Patescibacteria group bacterium]